MRKGEGINPEMRQRIERERMRRWGVCNRRKSMRGDKWRMRRDIKEKRTQVRRTVEHTVEPLLSRNASPPPPLHVYTLCKVSQCDTKTYVTPQRWREEMRNKEKGEKRRNQLQSRRKKFFRKLRMRKKVGCQTEGTIKSETVDV